MLSNKSTVKGNRGHLIYDSATVASCNDDVQGGPIKLSRLRTRKLRNGHN